ncbi:MAG: EamA family transporter RarD [Calditrichaeota bacterium]|nr:MAG: EamA family transporter RarD [Calditrichota bacterium]
MRGYLAALAAYFLWGLSPLFWKLLVSVPAIEILMHRIVWSFPLLIVLIVLRGQKKDFIQKVRSSGQRWPYIISAILLAGNWFTYIWAVNHAFIVEASLGYFINPLVNVLMGVLFLKEKMRSLQWVAVVMAALGVFYLTVHYGHFPWIALVLAFSFATYGLIRKTGVFEALEGLTFEMLILFLPALGFTYFLYTKQGLAAVNGTLLLTGLLILTGMVTILPLIWFAYGARRIPLSTMGFLQYIGPTLQFVLGVFVYNESFGMERLTGFGIIWLALALYTIDLVRQYRQYNRA